jgi:hypothetical protein
MSSSVADRARGERPNGPGGARVCPIHGRKETRAVRFAQAASGACDLPGSPSKRYLGAVAPRPRVLAFGSAAALIVAGSICAIQLEGLTGEAVAIALITLGLGAVVLLMFLEVGLSEERELAREEKRRRQRATDGERRLRPRRWPRRPG